MTELTFYALRHKATGHFMPTLRGRGYSNWTPTPQDPKGGIEEAFDVPRLFATAKGADNARVLWARGIHTRHAGTTHSFDGPDDYDEVEVKDVGRKKDDIEVIPMQLTPADRAVLHIKFSQQNCVDLMRKAFESTLAGYKEVGLSADAMSKLEELCGHWADGSSTTVTISQDDAVRCWVLRVGDGERAKRWTGSSLADVINQASNDRTA